MGSFQKFILHPVTSLLLAFTSYSFIAHYGLLHFDHAPLVFALTVAVGYLLLSRKYDPILSYLCLSAALFVSYKAATIPDQSPVSPVPLEERIYRALSLQVAIQQVQSIVLELKGLKLEQRELSQADFSVQSCLNNSCPEKFAAKVSSGDKNLTVYGLSADFDFFRVNQTGDIEEIFK